MTPDMELSRVAVQAALTALAVIAVELSLLHLLRSRSAAVQLTVVSAATLISMSAGIVAVTLTMINDTYGRAVVLTVVVVAALVGMVMSALLGWRLNAANRAVVRAVRGEPYRVPDVRLPAELAELAHELDRTYRRLAAAHARERALERSRRELVAWVSRDLRTPLAGLRAMAEALGDEVGDGAGDEVVTDAETVHRLHGRIRAEVKLLSEMVDDLFELSSIHAGVLGLSRDHVGAGDLVADMPPRGDAAALAEDVRLEESAVRRGALLQADPPRPGRVQRDLVNDAIRHAPVGGMIELRYSGEDGRARVTAPE